MLKTWCIDLADKLLVKKMKQPTVVFLSDDWGSLRIRSRKDREILEKKGLSLSNRFVLYDSLETNDDLELFLEVLTKHKDNFGNHPSITMVTNVANPDFLEIKKNDFNEYVFETIDSTYQRYSNSDRVLDLINEGVKSNVLVPQSHGREHLQINWWMKELQEEDSFARVCFENEFFLLPANKLINPKRDRGLGAAFDVWDQDDLQSHIEILSSALDIFNNLFGYVSKVFTPPAMYYNPDLEELMVAKGITWLDVGRFLKIPEVGGNQRFQFNYLGRPKRSGLKILVRNCVFETNISTYNDGVDRCLKDIQRAFNKNQPAIISNHRASFTGRIDKSNRDRGLKSLDLLLKLIVEKWPDVKFSSIVEI